MHLFCQSLYVPIPITGMVFVGMGMVWEILTCGIPVVLGDLEGLEVVAAFQPSQARLSAGSQPVPTIPCGDGCTI